MIGFTACRTPVVEPAPAGDVEALAAVPEADEVAISPDGAWIAYVTDASGARELVVERTGAHGAGARSTHLGENVTWPVFGPDGAAWFLSDHGGDERYDVWKMPAGQGDPTQVTHTETAEGAFAIASDGRLAYPSDPDAPFRFDLHVLAPGATAPTRLTHEPVNVVGVRWSPDGALLAATETGDDQSGPLVLVDAKSGALRRVEPGNGGILLAEAFSADGRTLLARTLDAEGFLQLALVNVADGATQLLARAPGDVGHVVWAGRGPVVFERNEQGVSRVYVLTSLSSTPTRLAVPDGVVSSLSITADGSRVALALATTIDPPRPYVLTLATGALDPQGPDPFGAGAPVRQVSKLVEWDSEGRRIAGLLTLPVRGASPPPLLVRVHGGPNGQARPEFSATLQALVHAGFAVLEPNYRGSTGFGRAFEDANNLDWGGGDLRDVIAGVRFVTGLGLADDRRVAIYGGSYGGYLTLRALTAVPEVFAAGCESFGMPDLVADYELTKDRFGDWYATEMGTPATQAALFRDRSPIHVLDRMRAPLLVLQGENDTNVPREESDLVVGKLRARGHPVEYAVYPGEGHGFTRRVTRIDATKRMVAFFLRTLGR